MTESAYTKTDPTPPTGLLAIDIDGTLITDNGHITCRVRDALGRAVDAGWEIVPTTGRTYPAAKGVTGELPFIRYAIASNGACIIDVQNNAPVHLELLPSDIAATVIRETRAAGAIPALYSSDVFHQKVRYDTLDGACEFFSIYIHEDPRTQNVNDVLDHTDDVLQIGMIAARDIIFDVRDRLASIDATVMTLPFESPRFGGKHYDWWFIQVVATNARKHTALERLVRLLTVPSGRLVAVGDNYNDTEMLASADVGVAMGNAPEEVKAHASVVVATNNDHGIAEVVEKVILSDAYFS